jgi:hypothetical protein
VSAWNIRMIKMGRVMPSAAVRSRLDVWAGVAFEWVLRAPAGSTQLCQYMDDNRWSDIGAARRLGCSREHLNRIKNGRMIPSERLAIRIAVWTKGEIMPTAWN